MNRLERWLLNSGEWYGELRVRPCFSVQLDRCSSEKGLGPSVCVCVCLCRHRHLFTPTSLRCPASLSSANGLLVSSLSLVLCFLPQRIQVCLDLHWSQEDASNFLVGGDNQYVDQMGLLIQ